MTVPTSAPAKTVVSLTPMPLDRDSRTLKIAASLAQSGFRSVVVENRTSAHGPDLPGVEVVTLGEPARAPVPGRPPSVDRPTRLKQILAPFFPPWLRERVHFFVFVVAYFLYRPLFSAGRVPPCDLYYLHEYRLFPLVQRCRRKYLAPLIYDAHDYYPDVAPEDSMSGFWSKRFQPLLGRMEEWCIRNADAVITVSDGVADLIEKRYGVKPVVIRNCHDSRIQCPPNRTVRETAGIEDDEFLVVTVGNRKAGRAVDEMIHALTLLPDHVHFAALGSGHKPGLDAAQRLGVENRFHAVGAVTPREVVPFLETADAAVVLYFPLTVNYRYCLPNGFFQSLAAGLPLLYPNLPEITSIIGERKVGKVIDPRNVDSLVAGVTWLLDNRDHLANLRQETARLVERVSWQNEETQLLNTVRDLL